MVNRTWRASLSDFGLAVVLESEDSVIRENSFAGPVKWMSYESICRNEHSIKSDVWMFAVLCWEIFRNGTTPWSNIKNSGAILKTKYGKTLDCGDWPEDILLILKQCWQRDAEKRPSTKEIQEFFKNQPRQDLLDSIDAKSPQPYMVAEARL